MSQRKLLHFRSRTAKQKHIKAEPILRPTRKNKPGQPIGQQCLHYIHAFAAFTTSENLNVVYVNLTDDLDDVMTKAS